MPLLRAVAPINISLEESNRHRVGPHLAFTRLDPCDDGKDDAQNGEDDGQRDADDDKHQRDAADDVDDFGDDPVHCILG